MKNYDHPGRTRPDQAPPLAADLGSADHGHAGAHRVYHGAAGRCGRVWRTCSMIPPKSRNMKISWKGLVLFDPMPFDGIENIDDLTLREGCGVGLHL